MPAHNIGQIEMGADLPFKTVCTLAEIKTFSVDLIQYLTSFSYQVDCLYVT